MPDPLAKISEGPATAVLAPTIVKGKMGTGAGAHYIVIGRCDMTSTECMEWDSGA